MGMNIGSGDGLGEPEVMMDVNTTPLIDVMLVLLVMFIMIMPAQLHAVKIDNPQGTPPPSTVEPIRHNVFIDFDESIALDGEPIQRAALEAKFQEFARMNPQPEVHIKPNKLAPYKTVMFVMASAQRNGLTKIGVPASADLMQ